MTDCFYRGRVLFKHFSAAPRYFLCRLLPCVYRTVKKYNINTGSLFPRLTNLFIPRWENIRISYCRKFVPFLMEDETCRVVLKSRFILIRSIHVIHSYLSSGKTMQRTCFLVTRRGSPATDRQYSQTACTLSLPGVSQYFTLPSSIPRLQPSTAARSFLSSRRVRSFPRLR
jgi:hypothetical protein